MVIELDGTLYQITYFQHVKPGKGGAFVRSKVKNLLTGRSVEKTFRAGENLPRAIIDRADYQYLYSDEMGFVCMSLETYEQITVSKG